MNAKRIGFFLFLLMVAAVPLFAGTPSEPVSLVGKPAPALGAKSWLNGGPQSLADLKGHPVVVEFWATWCPPCRTSIPHLVELNDKYRDKGLRFVSLTNETLEKVESFVREMKMTYPVGAGSDTGVAYGVRGIPHAFLIGHDGVVIWDGHPMDGLEKRIEEALAKVPDSVRSGWAADGRTGRAETAETELNRPAIEEKPATADKPLKGVASPGDGKKPE